MVKLVKTNAHNKDFIQLVKELDAELAIRDGDDHDFYHQFNHLDSIKYVVVLYIEGHAAACGAIKKFNDSTAEIKRMYTRNSCRGHGYASLIIRELEKWAQSLGFVKLILETGVNQPEAIALYKKKGFSIIENYGQYAGLSTSFCFERMI